MKLKRQKRQEAEERNDKYQSLTTEEKLKMLDSRPGKSKKQRKKLQSQLAPK